MIIFLYGSDSYRRKKRFDEIIGEYEKKHSSFSRDFFDLSEGAEFVRLKEFCGQMLMFGDKKLAVLKNIFERGEEKELKDFLKQFIDSKETILVISEEKTAPAGLKTVLSKSVIFEKFEELSGEKLKLFLRNEAESRGVTLSSEAAHFLANSFKGNVHGAVNELEKLGLAFGNRKIETADLFKVADYRQSPNIFSFINFASSEGGITGKISALEEIFLSQEEPAKIFNILSAGKRLSSRMIEKLADYDILVKSGKLDYDEVLVDLALS